MGCRHYFIVDRLEDLVDEGGSRSSSRAHEHENFRLASQLNVAIQIFQSRCPPRWTVWTNRWIVHWQRVSPFYLDLHLRFSLCPCLSLNVQQTNWCSCSQERNVYRFPEHSGSFRSTNWIRVWLGWLVDFCLSSNFRTQFRHPIMPQGKSSEAVEVTHILFRIWFLQFPSEQLSGYKKLGVYCKEWWRSIASDRTSILYFEQGWYRPNTPCSDVSPMLYACIVQDAVLPSRSSQNPCVP